MKLHYPFGPAPEGEDVLWRCEAKRYSVCVDPDWDEYSVTPPRLEMTWWRDLVALRGKTVVAVTHDLNLASQMHRRLHVVDGRLAKAEAFAPAAGIH